MSTWQIMFFHRKQNIISLSIFTEQKKVFNWLYYSRLEVAICIRTNTGDLKKPEMS